MRRNKFCAALLRFVVAGFLVTTTSGCFTCLAGFGAAWNGGMSTRDRVVVGLLDVVTMPVQAPFWILFGLDAGLTRLGDKISQAEWDAARRRALQRVKANPQLLEDACADYTHKGSKLGLAYGDMSVPFTEKALVAQAYQFFSRDRGFLMPTTGLEEFCQLMTRPEWTEEAYDAVAPQLYLGCDSLNHHKSKGEPPWCQILTNMPSRLRVAFERSPQLPPFRSKLRNGRSTPIVGDWRVAPSEKIDVRALTPAGRIVVPYFSAIADVPANWRITGMWNSFVAGELQTPQDFSSEGYQGKVVEIYGAAPSNQTITASFDGRIRVVAVKLEFPDADNCQRFVCELIPGARLCNPAFWDQLLYRPSLDEPVLYALCLKRRKVDKTDPCQLLIVDLTSPEQIRFVTPGDGTWSDRHVWSADVDYR